MGASSGPLPKDPKLRKRRNATTLETRQLQSVAAAAKNAVPAMPERSGKKAWSKPVKEWWAAMWTSPMAGMWLDSDVRAILPHLLQLHQFAHDAKKPNELLPLLAAIARQESRLGVSPADRRRLQWEVPPDAAEDAAPPERVQQDRNRPDPRQALSLHGAGQDARRSAS